MKNAIFYAIVLISFLLQGCNPFTKTISDYGYAELRPPTTLVPPGTVVEIKEKDPMVLGIICTQEASLGTDFKPRESSTYDKELVEKVNATFNIDADYLKLIKGNVKLKKIKNVKMTFSNASVAQLSADAVYENLAQRSPGCETAIGVYQNDGREVTMITSVLKADVTYDVVYEKEAGLSLDAKKEILKGLAAKLGISYKSSGESKISGEGLFWGIRDDSILVAKPVVEEDALIESVRTSEKVMSSHKEIRLIPAGVVSRVEKTFSH